VEKRRVFQNFSVFLMQFFRCTLLALYRSNTYSFFRGRGGMSTHRHNANLIWLDGGACVSHAVIARAHGIWTYEPRQGRKAATVVCSISAVVTLAFFIYDLRFTIYDFPRSAGLQFCSVGEMHSVIARSSTSPMIATGRRLPICDTANYQSALLRIGSPHAPGSPRVGGEIGRSVGRHFATQQNSILRYI
jgi:hypothetical protein